MIYLKLLDVIVFTMSMTIMQDKLSSFFTLIKLIVFIYTQNSNLHYSIHRLIKTEINS